MKSTTLSRGFMALTLAAILVSAFVIGFCREARPAVPPPQPTEVTMMPPPKSEQRDRTATTPQPARPVHMVVPPPAFEARDPGEWQGLLVDTSIRPPCDVSARCGLARACVENKCGACLTDAQCSSGEACVLDHCVLAKNVSCRAKADCTGEEELCVLSGYSPGPRGNAEMVAFCQSAKGGLDDPSEHRIAPEAVAAEAREMSPQRLMESLSEEE